MNIYNFVCLFLNQLRMQVVPERVFIKLKHFRFRSLCSGVRGKLIIKFVHTALTILRDAVWGNVHIMSAVDPMPS